MKGIYIKVKNEPIYIFNIKEKNKIKLFFEYGRRDEIQNGLAHMYEHILISYLNDFYNDFIEEINGYVDVDLIQIEVDITKGKKCLFMDLLINEDFSQMLKYKYYENNLNLINQELILYKTNFAEKIQKSIYSNFYFDERMKFVLQITKAPSFKDVEENFKLFIKSLNVILINNENMNLKIIDNNIIDKKQNFEKININLKKVIKENIDLKNMILLTKVALIDIEEFNIPDDIYYIRLISLIINKRLAVLKNKSSYFELCYVVFHRHEIYFSIVISGNKIMKEAILNELQKILSVDITDKEIEYIYEKNKVNNREVLYKENLVVLYKSDKFLNDKYNKKIHKEQLNYLLKYLIGRMKGLIEFY
ncbi:MAG: hypothetical protein ACRC57_13475 [Sarcina sp.]